MQRDDETVWATILAVGVGALVLVWAVVVGAASATTLLKCGGGAREVWPVGSGGVLREGA